MKKNALFIFLLFNIVCCSAAFAQKKGQTKIDSLEAVLKTAKEDTDKVNTLNALANEFSRSNLDTAIVLSTEAMQLAGKIKWPLGIGKSDRVIGRLSFLKGDYALSIEYYSKALAICDELEKSGVSPQSQVMSLRLKTISNMGSSYAEQGDFPRALDYHFKALEMAQEIGDKQIQANSYGNIAIVYKAQGDYPKALDYCLKALKLVDELGDKIGMASVLSNIGQVYWQQSDYPKALDNYFNALKTFDELGYKLQSGTVLGNIGNVYYDQQEYSKALDYDFKALKIAEELGDKNGISRHLSNIGSVYYERGDYQKTLDINFKALKVAQEIGDKYGIATRFTEIGASYTKLNKLNEADKFLNDALKLATEIKALELIKSDNETLSELYSKKGDWKRAYDYYKQYTSARDSLNNEEKAKKQTRIEMNYEFEKTQAADSAKHEKEMAVANVENKKQKLFRNVSIGGFSVMLLFAGVFFTQRNRISKGKKRSDELLLNILPSETAEELKLTGEAKAKNYDMVTVMFTDFKNFTQVSEKMSAEELVKDIHHYYSEFDKIIAKYNIEKIKTLGDSYMCAGGLPVENKTNPLEVVQAALEIQQYIAIEKEERQKNNKSFFEIRIGIHTGPVVAGIVGIKKFAYDIWGDTVNIASRMETSGEVGKVNISGSTYELVKDKFTCIHRGKIDAKNKGMIDMYFVEHEKS